MWIKNKLHYRVHKLLRVRDKTFHFILLILIGIFATTSYHYYNKSKTELMVNNFFNHEEWFKAEQDLQKMKEVVPAGATRVPIFTYHSIRPHISGEDEVLRHYTVSPESFEKQLAYLKAHDYAIIDMGYLAYTLRETIILPEKSVVLTFDDGWANQFNYAYPLLKKYNATGTFFIPTAQIGKPHFLTWEQVKLMDDAGMNFGAHTRTHPYLPLITDRTELEKEILGSKKDIETHLPERSIDLFAYPFGHYNDLIVDVVQKSGFKAARSTYRGRYNTRKDIYTMKSVEATDDMQDFIDALEKN